MDFNEYVERRGSGSSKWDNCEQAFQGVDAKGAIPMWVADTDYKCPPEIVDAVMQRAQMGIFGYPSRKTAGMENATVDWMKKRYGWEIEKNWIVYTPGIVTALCHTVQAFTQPGDGVIIQQPVYHPFCNSVVNNGRVVRNNGLILDEGGYRMNFEQLEQLAAEEHTKMMILCSPHNPVGRVWGREDVEKVCRICVEHDVLLVSDEIHADLLMKGVKFTSTGPVAGQYGTKVISCYAPSKTFNMAGLQASAIIIPDAEVRARFSRQLEMNGTPTLNVFACTALEAAWIGCEWYIEQAMAYIEDNMDHAIRFLQEHTPKIKMMKPEGTFLAWLDVRELGMTGEEIKRFFLEKAKIAVDPGDWFGQAGEGFARVNFACHRSTLDAALAQLQAAYEKEFT